MPSVTQEPVEVKKNPRPKVKPDIKRTVAVLVPIRPAAPGRVRVTEVTTGPRSQHVEVDEYAVGVTVEDEGLVAEVLKVRSEKDGKAVAIAQLDPYHTVVGGGEDSCDCPAGVYGGKCRHVPLIRKLICEGHLTRAGGGSERTV
jgi:hypothetical protein